jgi:peptide/nickel transport system substrate-binding protein
MEEMIQSWLDAPDAESQKTVADAVNKLAQDDVATIPLGQFSIRTAYRSNLTGFVKGSMPYSWGVRPA